MAAPACKAAVTSEEEEEVCSVRRCMVGKLETFHTVTRLESESAAESLQL